MLNKNQIRELSYLVKVNSVEPIPNYDRVELAHINGWRCIVPKGRFVEGSIGVYFEIDSRAPADNPAFAFLEKRHYKIRTIKMCGVASQGLLMHPSDFGWENVYDDNAFIVGVYDGKNYHYPNDESRFLTKELGITYAEDEDNKRKGKIDPNAKYTSMKARHKKIFSNPAIKKMMKYRWFREFMFFFFGKKKDKPMSFPACFPYVHCTDECRIENAPELLKDKRPLIASEKLDGTSSTYIMSRSKKNKFEFYVCSRHVRQLTPDQKCYHNDNVYWNNAFKYNIEKYLKDYLIENPELTYVCIQGESVGSPQGNPLKLTEDDLYIFNFIRSDVGRISSIEGKEIIEGWGMKWVPIISTHWINPDTMEEMKELATGHSLVNPDVMREGIVYRSANDNALSFKNVSIEYLLKHNG